MSEEIEFISEGYYFFPNLALYLVLLSVKGFDVLQPIPHTFQPVSKVGGSLKLCLEIILPPESYKQTVVYKSVFSIERIRYIMLNLYLFCEESSIK